MTSDREARRRTMCRVFSADPPLLLAAGASPRIWTLLNLAHAQAWVYLYCWKAHQAGTETVEPCNVNPTMRAAGGYAGSVGGWQ